MSDIVDNRREKLGDTIKRILDSTESARFAIGYFFISGLTAVREKLEDVNELRLLIGNTSDRETIEQMAEGYRRLEAVAEAAEEQLYQKGAEARRVAGLAAREVGGSLEVMDQTDEGEKLVKTLVRLIEAGRLKMRVYTRGGCTPKRTSSTTSQTGASRRASPWLARPTSRSPGSRTTPS